MTYATSPFSPIPLRVSSSDAPYGIVLEFEFRSFNGEILPASCPQFIGVTSRVTLHTREVATQAVEELRALADSIEAYIPTLSEQHMSICENQ